MIFGLSQYCERCGRISPSSKKTRDLPARNVVDDLPFLRLSPQLLGRPVCHRNPNLFGLLAGERDDLRDLFGGELWRGPRAVVVAEDVDDQRLKISVGYWLQLCAQQSIHLANPTMPPSSHALDVDAESSRLIDAAHTVGGHDDDARSLDESVLLRRGAAKPLQDGALSREQRNFRRSAGHRLGMIRIEAD
jgi:hypothetical protein